MAPVVAAPGVEALFDLYNLRVESLFSGGDLSPEIMATLERNIAGGPAHLARKVG